MNVILLGPPGSGKGTQGEIIKETFSLKQISTGDILRAKMNSNSPLADEIKRVMKTGALFSDETINLLVEETIKEIYDTMPNQGLLFDGFPRTIQQAVFLNDLLKKFNKKIDCVLNFYVPDEQIVDRVSARRIDRNTGKVYNLIFNPPPADQNLDLYQRVDDTEEVIKNRLDIYHKKTEKLVEFYKDLGLVEYVDATYELNVIKNNIENILKKYQN